MVLSLQSIFSLQRIGRFVAFLTHLKRLDIERLETEAISETTLALDSWRSLGLGGSFLVSGGIVPRRRTNV
jgi:hypothetical protein